MDTALVKRRRITLMGSRAKWDVRSCCDVAAQDRLARPLAPSCVLSSC